MRRAAGSSPLLEAAAERLNQAPIPQAGIGLVHGDLWQGNTLWTGGTFVGMVSWDAAGMGRPNPEQPARRVPSCRPRLA
jgi:aminoglycoside phosphotransferase (APT) family kinase protein